MIILNNYMHNVKFVNKKSDAQLHSFSLERTCKAIIFDMLNLSFGHIPTL